MPNIDECRAKADEALAAAKQTTNWRLKADLWDVALDWLILGSDADSKPGASCGADDPDRR